MREVLFSHAKFRPNVYDAEVTNGQIHLLTFEENLSGKTRELGSVSFVRVAFVYVYYLRKLVLFNL